MLTCYHVQISAIAKSAACAFHVLVLNVFYTVHADFVSLSNGAMSVALEDRISDGCKVALKAWQRRCLGNYSIASRIPPGLVSGRIENPQKLMLFIEHL